MRDRHTDRQTEGHDYYTFRLGYASREMYQVAQLSERDCAMHKLLRFAKLKSEIFEPPFLGAQGKRRCFMRTSLEEAWSTSYR